MNTMTAVLLLAACSSAIAQDAYEAGIALSPDERYFAVGNAGNSIHLHQVSDGKLVRSFEYKYGILTKPAFSPDGKLITAGSVDPDGGVNPVWRVDTGILVAKPGLYSGKEGALPCDVVGFSGDGKLLLGQIFGAAYTQGGMAWRTNPWEHAYFRGRERDWDGGAAAVSPKGSLVVTFREYGPDFWDPEGKGEEPWTDWPVYWPEGIRYAAFSRDGNVIVVAGDGWAGALDWRDLPKFEGEVVIIDTEKGIDRTRRVKKSEAIVDFVIRSVCASNDGKEAFIGSRDGRIARIDLRSGKVLKMWQAFPEAVKGLVQTKQRTLLAYNLEAIRYWSADGDLLKTVASKPQKRG